jgi:3-hydroxyisobutyrate dehydrogenase
MSTDKMRIGWIGTGVMGNPMCGHIMDGGYDVAVYTRTRSRAENLLARGAVWKENPREVAEDADIVFTLVAYPRDVEEVILGGEGALAGLKKGGIVVDMTTSSPALAERISAEAEKRGAGAIDAPVSGGDVGAKQGTLAVMCGGTRKDFDRVSPLLALMGKNVVLMGGPGRGQHTKMSNQIHIATTMIGTVECLLYAWKAGLDLDQVIGVVGSGAAASWSLNNLGPRIVRRNFDPGFFIDHFIKDMGIALDEAKRMDLSLPGLALAHQFYVAARAEGFGKEGTHALARVFEKMNGLEMKPRR